MFDCVAICASYGELLTSYNRWQCDTVCTLAIISRERTLLCLSCHLAEPHVTLLTLKHASENSHTLSSSAAFLQVLTKEGRIVVEGVNVKVCYQDSHISAGRI